MLDPDARFRQRTLSLPARTPVQHPLGEYRLGVGSERAYDVGPLVQREDR
jgi:hypothetical protein